MLTRYYYIDEFSKYSHIFREYPHEEQAFPKGSYLCPPGSELTKVFWVEEGLTKLSVAHETGEEKIFGFWGRGSIFPIICTEQKFNLEYSLLMQAVTDVKAMAFAPEVFKSILKEHSGVMYEVIDHYCRFCNMLLFNATTQSYEPVLTRICNILYTYLYYIQPPDSCVELSQEDIASIIGSTRVTVAREIAGLKKRGVIRTTRKKIYVLDREEIKKSASDFCK